MSLTTDLLIVLAVFLIANCYAINFEGSALNGDDEENSLKQAIFLVELLKSDFAKGLRVSNYSTSNADNATENNSTCPMPTGDIENTTEPATSADLNLASILPGFPIRSDVSAVTPATSPEVRIDAGAPGYVAPGYGAPGYGAPGYGVPGYGAPGLGAPGSSSPGPGGPPLSNWPAMPNMPMLPPGYPQQRNFPADENYRFPYRFRRRMMPDYYYFDAPPINPQGNYRRQGSNDPPGNETANTQPQTSSVPSTTSEVTTLHVEESTTKTSTFLTTVSSQSTNSSTQVSPVQSTQTSQESPLQTTQTASQVSSLQSTQTSTQDSSLQSILLAKPATEQTTAPIIIQSRAGFTTPAFISKETSSIISKRKKKHKLKKSAAGYHLRQRKTTSTSEKYTSEDVEMSQVASELIKEFKGTPTKNMPQFPSEFEKLTSRRKTSTTMKIYLKGSSRLPVPLPENNAFCHAYPRNVLCGYVM